MSNKRAKSRRKAKQQKNWMKKNPVTTVAIATAVFLIVAFALVMLWEERVENNNSFYPEPVSGVSEYIMSDPGLMKICSAVSEGGHDLLQWAILPTDYQTAAVLEFGGLIPESFTCTVYPEGLPQLQIAFKQDLERNHHPQLANSFSIHRWVIDLSDRQPVWSKF